MSAMIGFYIGAVLIQICFAVIHEPIRGMNLGCIVGMTIMTAVALFTV